MVVAGMIMAAAALMATAAANGGTTDEYIAQTGVPPESLSDPGVAAEHSLYERLRAAYGDEAEFLFGLYMPTVGGCYTEVDAVMLHPGGVFVFESKSREGDITADMSDREWEVRYPGGVQKMYSPIRQNERHIEALKAYLPRGVPVYSVVCLDGNGRLELTGDAPPMTVVTESWKAVPVISGLIGASYLDGEAIRKLRTELLRAGKRTDEKIKMHKVDVARKSGKFF